MTVRELLKEMKREAKKSGIIDKEIWESPSNVRCKNTFLMAFNKDDGERGLDHFEMGFRHGSSKPIKVVCKKY